MGGLLNKLYLKLPAFQFPFLMQVDEHVDCEGLEGAPMPACPSIGGDVYVGRMVGHLTGQACGHRFGHCWDIAVAEPPAGRKLEPWGDANIKKVSTK